MSAFASRGCWQEGYGTGVKVTAKVMVENKGSYKVPARGLDAKN